MRAILQERSNGTGPRDDGGSLQQRTSFSTGGTWGGAQMEEDFILPDQYFERLRQKANCPGEERLMLAVLEDAVHCFQANLFARSARRHRLFAEAEEWLFDPASDALVTFDYVCSVFDLNSEYLRGGLRRWRESKEESAGRAPAVSETHSASEETETVPFRRAVGE